jgi:hypothetical protein
MKQLHVGAILGLLVSAPALADDIAKIERVTDLEEHDVRYPTPLAQLLKGALPGAQRQNVARNMDIQSGDSVETGRANTHVSMNRGDRTATLFAETLVSFDSLNVWAIDHGATYIVNPRGSLQLIKRKLATILANSSFYVEVSDDRLLLYVTEGLVTVQTSLGSIQLTASQAGRVFPGGRVQQTTLSGSEEGHIRSQIRAARHLMSAGGGVAGAVTVGATVVAAGAAAYAARDSLSHGPTYPEHVAPQADLAVTASSSTGGPAVVNVPFSLLLQVTNNGPQAATNVVLTDPIPGAFSIQTATSAQASCTVSGTTVQCVRAALPVRQSFSVTIQVVAQRVTPSVANAASVTGTEIDPDPTNNFGSVSVVVVPPQQEADIAVSQTFQTLVQPPTARRRLNVTVQNRGPTAVVSDIVLDVAVAPSAPWVLESESIEPSSLMRDCSPIYPGIHLRCNMTLAPFQAASVTFEIQDNSKGAFTPFTSIATTACNAVDPDCSNNINTLVVSASVPRDTVPALTQDRQPRTVARSSSLTSMLSIGGAGQLQGAIALNGQYLGTVERSSPHRLPFVGRPGENHIEAWLTGSPMTAAVWQFSFEETPGFVPGSLRVESGDPVLSSDCVLAFRLGSAVTRVRFVFSLAE